MVLLNDESIVQQLQSHDPSKKNQALAQLYEANYPVIANFIKQNSGTDADAEDIFQDSLIALYNKASDGNLTLTASLTTFLYAIARNLWLKKLRRKDRNVELKETHENKAVDSDIFNSLVTNERSELIASLLSMMGADCRNVLRYYYYDRMNMKEIAELMGWKTVQVAKNKKSTCMKKLKSLVMKNPGFKAALK